MTVRLATGDVSGDPAPRSPATSPTGRDDACLTERPLGGRFWALQLSDDEGDGDAEEVLPAGASDPRRYLWQTPISGSERDISERSSELVQRAIKRRNRQKAQREVAIDVIQFEDEGNNGGNAMDMDPKTNDGDATSNNNDQVGPNGNNGGDGMQEQLEHFDAIRIGSMNVKLSPSGSSPFVSNLSKNDPSYRSLFHVENLLANDKNYTDFHTDFMPRGSALGLSPVSPRVACVEDVGERSCAAATARCSSQPATARGSWSAQQEQRGCSQSRPAACAGESSSGQPRSAQQEQRSCSQPQNAACVKNVGERSCSGQPLHAVAVPVGQATIDAGLYVADAAPFMANSEVPPQKIRPDKLGGPGLHKDAAANHEAMIGNDVQSLVAPGGSSVAALPAANGMGQNSENFISSNVNLDEPSIAFSNSVHVLYDGNTCDSGLARKLKDGMMNDSMVNATERPGTCLQGSMEIASSPQTNGERHFLEEIFQRGEPDLPPEEGLMLLSRTQDMDALETKYRGHGLMATN
ncbi:hypothetical protein ACQ4PT_025290 [Festuca glaucescens]